MNVLEKTLNRISDRLHERMKYERKVLFGTDLTLRTGTFRKIPDYDDAWFLALARHSETVFDVGANVGYDAVLCLSATQVRRVVLLEANPKALAIAAENLVINNLSAAATFVSAFVGDSLDERVKFWTVGAGAAGSMHGGHAKTASGCGSSIEVPTITLDAVMENYGVVPDLVKCDVEGAEGKVLAGSRNLAAKQQTRFIVEMHSNPDLSMQKNASLALSWCRENNYAAWYLSDKVLLESEEPIVGRGRCHLLLQPTNWEFPDWLRNLRQGASLSDAMV